MSGIALLLSMTSSLNFLPPTTANVDSRIRDNHSFLEVVEKQEESSYDFMTYDFDGHRNFYHYSDFSFEDIDSNTNFSKTNIAVSMAAGSSVGYRSLPYSAICTVYTCYDTDKNGQGDTTYVGTGALVGPDEVLTAEENTYITEYGYPSCIYVAFGEHYEDGTLLRPLDIQNVTAVMRGNYHSTFNPNDNWALMRIDSTIGYTTGWLSVSEKGISNKSTVKTLGYDSTSSYQCVTYTGSVSNLRTYSFRHSSSPSSMANGAPIFDANLKNVVGIQTGARTNVGGNTFSEACKVSVYIRKWIQEDCGNLRITIFAQPTGQNGSSFGDWGHAWITVENNSPFSVKVGKMNISSHSAVSIGTWQSNPHTGLFYNLEYLHTHDGNDLFPNRVSYSRNVFYSKWVNANSYVEEHDSWSAPNNMCTNFALGVWNKVLPDYEMNCSATPNAITGKIKQFDGYKEHAAVPGTSNCGYFDNNTFKTVRI